MMLFTPPHTPNPSPSPSPSGYARADVFTPGTATAALSDRMRILARLVSAAVASRNLAVLNCTGVWMQQLVRIESIISNCPIFFSLFRFYRQGCLSQHSLNLSRVFIEDYFVLNTPQSNVPPFFLLFDILCQFNTNQFFSQQFSSSSACLEQLPQLAPHFTACFLTAAAELYGGIGKIFNEY